MGVVDNDPSAAGGGNVSPASGAPFTPGQQSSKDHQFADTDQGAGAIHHTLGLKSGQAAPGDAFKKARDSIPALASSAETIAATSEAKATTPKGVKAGFDSWGALLVARVTKLEDGWVPAIATTLSSSGSTATLNTTTGVVTIPAGCTQLRLDGLFQAGYEYEFVLDLMVDSKDASAGSSAFIRMREGGVSNASAAYQCGGSYGQYNGTWGTYSVNAGTRAPIGAVAGNGTYADFTGTLRMKAFKANGFSTRNYFFYFIDTFTYGSARGVRAGGYTPGATTAFDGIEFWWNGSLTGLAQGKIRIYKRKLQ